MDSRLWVHALLWPDMAQLCIVGWVLQVLAVGGGAGEIADQVQVLAAGCGDAERLLHESVGLVAIAVWSIVGGFVLGALETVPI